MNYLKIVINAYTDTQVQGNTYKSYFIQEAQKARRDDFCEYDDFIIGCKKTIQDLKNNIEQQLANCQHEHKKMMNLYYMGEMKAKDEHFITDKLEQEINVAKIRQQMETFGLNNFRVNINDVPRFAYSELLELEKQIEQAEMELKNKKTENIISQIQSISGENIVVNNGNIEGSQNINQKKSFLNNSKKWTIISTIITLLGIIVTIVSIVGWEKISNLFK